MDSHIPETTLKKIPVRQLSTTSFALLGAVLLYLALPPVSWGWIAWIAPIPWLMLILQAAPLSGNRPYKKLWLVGFLFWLCMIHWIRYAHPMNYISWVALAAYLGAYLPLFIGLGRVAVHRFRLPLWFAGPAVWVGLELFRAHFLSGFLMAALGHSQYKNLVLLQIADFAGAYGVSFLVMLVAASLALAFRNQLLWFTKRGKEYSLKTKQCLPSEKHQDLEQGLEQQDSDDYSGCRKVHWLALLPAVCGLIFTIYYGEFRLAEYQKRTEQDTRAPLLIALIQGSYSPEVKGDPDRNQEIITEYEELTFKAYQETFGRPAHAVEAQSKKGFDLIVWPETTYIHGWWEFESGFKKPADWKSEPEEWVAATTRYLRSLARQTNSNLLLGAPHRFYGNDPKTGKTISKNFNATLPVTREGEILEPYDKMVLVMFGEYIPILEWFPSLYKMTPMGNGSTRGSEPRVHEIEAVRYLPNICYESVLPHYIRYQVKTLEAKSGPVDLLVTVTNDAWFRDSSSLEMHMVCGVFRAVECRRPLVTAANGGLTFAVEGSGKISGKLMSQEVNYLIAPIQRDGRKSLYVRHGDWFAGGCLVICAVCLVVGTLERRRNLRML